MQTNDWHCLPLDEAASRLAVDVQAGLDTETVRERLSKYGTNELEEKAPPGLMQMLAAQFNNFLVIVLIIAAVVSLLLGEYVDAAAILTIVTLNAIVGVVQESKAEAALAAIKKMAAPNAQVIRGGHQETIASKDLVPGDIVLLEAGNYVPADLRLVESVNLKIEEASLTGESVPVEKNAKTVLARDIPLGDRKNSAFMSTLVSNGRGTGLVIGTGMKTEIGKIAEMLQSCKDEATPLQLKLDQLAKMLGIICFSICGVIFAYGLIRDTHLSLIMEKGPMFYLRAEMKDIVELFMTAVSLAIAAVPEGLPAVVTICLALGMQRMIRKHALIRKLPAVETLGCATVICSDKTGTLTQNQMTVVKAWTGGKGYKLTGEGYSPFGQFLTDDGPLDPSADRNLALLLHGACLCNDAKLEKNDVEQSKDAWRVIGDPTEGAMVVAAAKAGLWRGEVEQALPRVQEIPFDSDRKRMTTIHQIQNGNSRLDFNGSTATAFVKGAPDVILDLCTHALSNGNVVRLSEEKKKEILGVNRDLARQALRVLGVGYRPLDAVPSECSPDAIEQNLTFVGLMGMIDPARPEVKEAVKIAHDAGLKSVMVTGDYKDTAEAIAREIGILRTGGKVLTGTELDKMDKKELTGIIDDVDVCCRVSPANKTQIVDLFKARGHVVAMTGDGVNDAPALKRANIGVAMGITGTDVSKETADMVLTDDNFASIVAAIEQGRIIYSNIRKFVYFLISCNIGEILIIFVAMLFGMPMPLRPVQLLMLNLITDGAPALALGMEEGDPDIMKSPPRPPDEFMINWEMKIGIVVQAIVMTAAVLVCYFLSLRMYPGDTAHAQTIAFATLCMSELLRAFTARSEHHGLFSIGVFSNKYMVWAVGGSALLVLLSIYIPAFQPFFDTTPLSFFDWLMMTPFILMASVAAEITKVFIRRHAARKTAAIA
ncbi:MAG: cation-translocating P-type ATPase [Syntrophobacteraceae bacterium]|nr:cation-translocating P-type ATPase [Desulfobacteraceae bacterium]